MRLPEKYFINPPVVVLMASKGAGPKPVGFCGKWPQRGEVFACRLSYCGITGEELVTAYGCNSPEPFKRWRWRLIAMVWQN